MRLSSRNTTVRAACRSVPARVLALGMTTYDPEIWYLLVLWNFSQSRNRRLNGKRSDDPCQLSGIKGRDGDLRIRCSIRFRKVARAASRISASSRSLILRLCFRAQYRRLATSGLFRNAEPKLQHQRTKSFAWEAVAGGGGSKSDGVS